MNTKKHLTNKKIVILIAVFCSILWGSAFPVLKVSYKELNMAPDDMIAKIVLAGMRFLLAGIILSLLLTVVMKMSMKVRKKDISKLLLLGVLQTVLQYFFFYNGLAHTSGMKGAILNSIGNFFVVLLAHYIYTDDKINKGKIIGLITGFGGIVLVNWGKSFSLDFSFSGEGFLMIAGLVGAVGTIVAKGISKDIHPFLMTAWQMILGSMILIAFGVPYLKPAAITFTPKGWILLIYSAFLSATAFSLWYSILKYNKAGEISLYRFVIPISGAILSAIFIKEEKFNVYILLALALVTLGIIAINYNPNRSKKTRNNKSN